MKNGFTYASNYLPGYVTALLCLVFSVNAFAQKDTSKLKEVNINSSVAPKLQSAAPSQTITSNEFNQFNALNVADAVQHFAGVIVKDYGGVGGLKTISVRGLSANYTAFLYDGVQINDAENGQIDLGKFNLNSIQSITLYNGQPSNILQTARAFAAASVLDIQTVKPVLTAAKPYSITAGIKTGSFGLFNPYVQWQQRLNNNWSFVINTYTENANGRYQYQVNNGANINYYTRDGSDVAIQQTDGALYWQKNDSSKFNLHINYYNSNRGLPGPVILYTPPSWGQRLWNQDLFLQAGYEHTWKRGFHLLLNSKFSNDFLHYLDPHFQSTSTILDQHYTQREFYQSAALSYHLLPNWEFSYAADVAVNNMDADIPGFRHPSRLTLLNVLASNLILGKFTFEANLLNTRMSETVSKGNTIPNRNSYSPTIMASVRPLADPNFQLRAFYKSIFRYPTFQDLYYGFVPNVNLKPEFAHQYNLGANYRKNLDGLLDFITVTTDVYYNHVINKIVFIPTLYYGSTQNFGKVDIKGVDAGLQTQSSLGRKYKVSLSATYSHQQALNVTGPVTANTYLNQLPYTPLNSANLNAGINRGKIGVYYDQLWSASRYYNGDNNNDPVIGDWMPPYALSNASVVYTGLINHHKIDASAGINNLFNRYYEVVKSYPMPGRSFMLSFQITI